MRSYILFMLFYTDRYLLLGSWSIFGGAQCIQALKRSDAFLLFQIPHNRRYGSIKIIFIHIFLTHFLCKIALDLRTDVRYNGFKNKSLPFLYSSALSRPSFSIPKPCGGCGAENAICVSVCPKRLSSPMNISSASVVSNATLIS